MQTKRIIAIVPAAGSGTRFGSATPKQLQMLDGRPVLARTVDRLRTAGADEVVVAVSPENRDEIAGLLPDVTIVLGGATRHDSVAAGLASIEAREGLLVAVHDAVRPAFSRAVWDRLIAALATHDGAIPGVAPTDTVHRVEDGIIAATIDRSRLALAQTPQIFRLEVLRAAFTATERDAANATDEAGVVVRAGYRVAVVDGEPGNLKITTREDLARIESDGRWREW